MGMQTSNKAAATFDSTYGWLMTAWTSDSGYNYNYGYEQDEEAMKYTTNGRSFREFPALNYTIDTSYSTIVDCLETLDNGGDIFAITTSITRGYWNELDDWESTDIFIFHGNTSTWEHKANITWSSLSKVAGMYEKMKIHKML